MKRKTAAILNIGVGVFFGLFLAVPLAFKNKEVIGLKKKEPVVKYYTPAHPEQLNFAG